MGEVGRNLGDRGLGNVEDGHRKGSRGPEVGDCMLLNTTKFMLKTFQQTVYSIKF